MESKENRRDKRDQDKRYNTQRIDKDIGWKHTCWKTKNRGNSTSKICKICAFANPNVLNINKRQESSKVDQEDWEG